MLVALKDGNLTLISELSTGGRAVHAEAGGAADRGCTESACTQTNRGEPHGIVIAGQAAKQE